MYRIKITDRKTGLIRIRSPVEARDYIKNKYPGLYPDPDGIIKAILDGATIVAHHDIFMRVTAPKD